MEEKSKDNLLPLYVEDENNTMNKKVIHNNISCEGSVMIVDEVIGNTHDIKNSDQNLLLGMTFMLI